MSVLVTSLIRHVAPVVAVYITSPEFKEHVAVAVTAGVAFVWSVLEKKAGIKDGLRK